MNLQNLIHKCKKNNGLAQKEIFNMYIYKMYNICYRYLNNHDDVQDALMLSFERVFRNIKQFEYQGEKSLEYWIRRVVVNESIRLLSQRKKLNWIEPLPDFQDDETADCFISYDINEINKLIQLLPTGYRTVLSLYVIEEYGHDEIAKKLNISVNTSKSQLSKARAYLQNLLKKQLGYERA